MGKSINMTQRVKCLTINRYERGLMVRALYNLWKQALIEEGATEDIELLLKVIDAQTRKRFGRFP